MSKCSRVGCNKEGQRLMVPIFGGMAQAEVIGCSEHIKEIMASLP